MAALLALATASFVAVMTEALPAGLMAQLRDGLGVSEARVGQLVTLYALGTMVTAIPLTAATRGVERRALLLWALAGFAVFNGVTAISSHYGVTLVARGLTGISAGLLWSLVAGYASRLVAPAQAGRAMAIAMVGIPLALSLGIPAGTFLGAQVGWRATFGLLSAVTVVLLGWVRASLPTTPGQAASERLSLRAVFRLPGVAPVLFVTLAYVLAHNILYTFLVPFLAPAGLSGAIDIVLLVFGIAALAGIWLTGIFIDRWLRALMLGSIAVFVIVVLGFVRWADDPRVIYAGVALWGLAYGGVATLVQTASAKAAGDAAEVAQSMIVTAWNIAIASAGLGGAALLDTLGAGSFPGAVLALLIAAGIATWAASAHGFPRRATGRERIVAHVLAPPPDAATMRGMELTGRTLLLTGGSSGIGLALTQRLVAAGNTVIVTGRREAALEEVRKALPQVVAIVADSGDAASRAKLAAEVVAKFPALDGVIHNAGIQRAIDLTNPEAWEQTREEIAINLDGPIHLTALLLPHLLEQPRATIINVSSGLAFAPLARVPVYCATKAALHSYTQSLRHQLRATSVEVIEVIPPAVYSNLGGSHAFGVPTDEYADSVIAQLREGRSEVTYQFSAEASQASRAQLDAMFGRLNGND